MTDCPLVMIEWEDSIQPIPRWTHLSDFEKGPAIKCASVGWLIQDDEQAKALAPNMGEIRDPEQVQASGIIRIPTCAITRVVRLREGKTITCDGPSSRPVPTQKRKRA